MIEQSLEHVTKIVNQRVLDLAGLVVSGLKDLGRDSCLSSEDSGFECVWDEICFQRQSGDYSWGWELYESTILTITLDVLSTLTAFEQKILWFHTDAYVEWDESEGEDPPIIISDIADMLMDVVLRIAGGYSSVSDLVYGP